jgi:hypothetical protein
MGHSVGDGLIVVALAGALVAYLYFKHVERRRRLEIIHQERVAAMDKGIPLPELPLDPTKESGPVDPRAPLMHGLIWVSLGAGGMIALALGPFPNASSIWPLPVPLVTLGGGLILYYLLASERGR